MKVESLYAQGKVSVASLTKATPTTLTCPTGHRYLVLWATVNYVADATVATRIVTVYVDHGTPESHFAKFDITASQNLRFALGWNNPAYAAYLVAGVLLSAPFIMSAGDVFCVGVSNGQAGDAWTSRVQYIDIGV